MQETEASKLIISQALQETLDTLKMVANTKKPTNALEYLTKAMSSMIDEKTTNDKTESSQTEGIRECITLLKLNQTESARSLAIVKESTDNLVDQINKQNEMQSIFQIKQSRIQAQQLKHQSLTWALDNVSNDFCNSFKYYNEQQELLDGQKLLKTILLSFRKGSGHYIDNRVLEVDYHKSGGKFGAFDCEIFRTRVVAEVETLIGMKPMLRKYEGRNAIFFPED